MRGQRIQNTEDSLDAGRMGGQFNQERNLTASQEVLRVVTPAKAGVQSLMERLDSSLRGNDRKRRILASWESINLAKFHTSIQQGRWATLFILALTSIFIWLGARDAIAQPQEFDGLIEPKLTTNVGSNTPGILESVSVDRGDMIKEGQVVAILQAGVEKATMDLAKAKAEIDATIKAKRAELEYAERNKQRKKELYEKKTLSFQEWDEAETRRILAELALNEALEAKRLAELEYKRSVEVVKRMSIRSPVNGVVVERYLHPGEYIEDKPVMKLAQVDPLHVEVIMPVSMLGSINVGTFADVKPEAPVGGVYKAKVTIVDKVVDAASGTFGVRLELPNRDYKLPPGLKCKVLFLKP